ncbi:MAG TPA: hypothetical protein VFE34_01150 [Dongiaceae bacterium]|jgi:hypothetical protein|nr:hypothetical protein [Dongiaceae bacterium]
MVKAILTAIIAAASLCACTYDVKTTASPALNVYSSYTDKLPGSYALLVQSDILAKKVDPSSHACSANNYPIDARATFKQSATDTMAQLVEKLEPVEQALTREQLQAGNYRGQIIIKAEDYDPRLTFVPGFWTATASSTVDISASLLVDGPSGRLLGTKASESRTEESEVSGCGGGKDALGRANGKATEALLDRLAERFSSEPRLRATSAALP